MKHSPSAVEATVIVPARDAAATLADQLEALARQDAEFPWEVLVVDNGSTDTTVQVARGYADRVPLLRVLACPRTGANAARNFGAEAARSERLLFCDADDVVDQAWVRILATALGEHEAVGGGIDNNTFPPGHMPRYPDRLPVSAGFLPRAITANFGVRRPVWEEIGGFSEDYVYGSTDTEFCWRLQLAGHALHYEPAALVAYRHRNTLSSAVRKSYRTGKAHVRLYRDFREHGMQRSTFPRVAYRWARLVVTAPGAACSKSFRWRWAREAAAAAGRVVGSADMRLRYL